MKKKVVAIGIARMGSSRLPGKVMRELGGFIVIDWVHLACEMAPGVDEFVVATSTDPRDDVIEEWCKANDVKVFRGSEDDVLSRFYGAAKAYEADIAIRVTCDCPFLDPAVIGQVVALHHATGADYTSNIDPPTWPDGLDCEAINIDALETANNIATRKSDKECVTTFISRNRATFKTANLECPLPGLHKERWVLDTALDWVLCKEIAEVVEPGCSYIDTLNHLNENPHLRKINAGHIRNERFFDNIAGEEPIKREFESSKIYLAEAKEIIPLGAQTFSKSYLQYPQNAPMFLTHGNGGLVYDVDGNEYVDLVSGLLPNVLGYRDPDVDWAIRDQLSRGISFSLATDREYELAHMLKTIIPSAEMVRFGKNGTDVTSAAIRLARHITKKDHILTSGYHGWSDWAIANDKIRNNGVPKCERALVTDFKYGDKGAVEKALKTGKYACVIVEPEKDPNFLEWLRVETDRRGALLIFDEIITGFRIAMGGAQELYGVTPDLSTFGKAMGNGMPISAIVGMKKYMKEMENICFSGTFFGEALSLAASIATIEKMEKENVIDGLVKRNEQIIYWIKNFFMSNNEIFVVPRGDRFLRLNFKSGDNFTSEDMKALFMQEMIKHGVLIIASHNFCHAHSDADMRRILYAYECTFKTIQEAVAGNRVKEAIVGTNRITAASNVRNR